MGLALLLAGLAVAPGDLAVLGVVLGARPEANVAVLRSGERTRVVAVGDTAFGARVAAITPSGVRLDFAGEVHEVRLPASPQPGMAAPPAPAAAVDPENPPREMAREEVQRRLALETNRILTETTLVPVQDEESVAGFALTRIPEGSLLSDAGLKPGDVLTSINDVPIDSFATLMGLWPRLQNESELRAVVMREGRPVTLTLTLR